MAWRCLPLSGRPHERRSADLLTGKVFADRGISNLVDSDFFSWPVRGAVAAAGERVVDGLLELVDYYDLARMREDVLKSLYERLVSRSERERLGEVYTPDWLAERIVGRALADDPAASVLDPACGIRDLPLHRRQEKTAGDRRPGRRRERPVVRLRDRRSPARRHHRQGQPAARPRGPAGRNRRGTDRDPGLPHRQRPPAGERGRRRRLRPRRVRLRGGTGRRHRPPARLGVRGSRSVRQAHRRRRRVRRDQQRSEVDPGGRHDGVPRRPKPPRARSRRRAARRPVRQDGRPHPHRPGHDLGVRPQKLRQAAHPQRPLRRDRGQPALGHIKDDGAGLRRTGVRAFR